MKQIFKLSIILLALTCCVSSFDASAKTKRKAKSTATTSKWVELGRNTVEIWYINPDIKIQYDNDGYPIVTVKQVPLKSYLETQRKNNININNDSRYKNYTHKIVQWKVDVDNMRMTIMTISDYSNNNMLKMTNCASYPNWGKCEFNTLTYELAKLVRYAIKGY